MSVPAQWPDPTTGTEESTPEGTRVERAARADSAVTAARAARAALASSAAGRAASVGPVTEDSPQVAVATVAVTDGHAAYSVLTLGLGVLARMVLAFVTGCLLITLLPLVLGWRPYVVKSGSMEPRIRVGDVILASPQHDPAQLLGRVTVFEDPAKPGSVKSHRVIAINPDGSLTTKGDANPTADPVHAQAAQVRGLGRLLVRYAGLPLVWLQTGQYVAFAAFLLVLAGSVWAASRDHEEDEDDDEIDGDDEIDPDGEPRHAAGQRSSRRSRSRSTIRASLHRRPRDPATTVIRRAVVRTAVVRTAVVTLGAGALLLPGASAAFSATTRTTASSWSVPSYSYTTAVKGFSPYLYWKLDETTGTSAADASGNARTGTYSSAAVYTRGITGATPDSAPNTGVTQTASTACLNTTSTTAIAAPSVLTEIIWFKTAAGYASGGKLIGFESPRTGTAVAGSGGSYDRQLYMDGSGRIWFGVYNGGDFSASTSTSYNDGSWHMAAATLGPTGMALYVDGVLRDSDANATGEASTGWWRVGCGNLAGWGNEWTGANTPGTDSTITANRPFLGSVDEATVYQGTALTAANIGYLYWTR